MKNLSKLGTPLQRKEQQNIIGGGKTLDLGCSGCHPLFFCQEGTTTCAIPDGNGGVCYGKLENGLCCV